MPGVYVPGALSNYTVEMFDQTSTINFKGVFFSVQKVIPYLNVGVSIILTGSTVSDNGMLTIPAYAATKGCRMMTGP